MGKQEFVTAYRAVRMLANYGLTSPSETIEDAALPAAIRGRFSRIEHRGGVECAKTAPDYHVCIGLHLTAARYRRLNNWADKQCVKRFGARAARMPRHA